MGRRKANPIDSGEYSNRTPARSPEERENRMIALAMDLVEKRLLEGTASSAETVHFLKLGSSRERLEQADKRREIELKAAKTEALESTRRIEELYSNAVNAMRKYGGQNED